MGAIEYRTMRAGERDSFLALMEAAFVDEDVAHFARALDEDPQLTHDDTLVAVDGGRVVSAVQIFTRRIGLRGASVALGGIGSVATHPRYEGRGQASELLRRAIVEMRARALPLSLLFTGRIGFYERLGWVSVPHPLLLVRRGAATPAPAGRPFEASDLRAVKGVYAGYSARRDGATRRDDAYWAAQLRFAGNPDERFVVGERGGRVVAYARLIRFLTLERIIEHACEPGAEPDLAALLLGLAPADAPLYLPRCDDALEGALAKRGASLEGVAFPDQMWRVLDRGRLLGLAGAGPGVSDEDLLTSLIGGADSVFWPSDRF